MNEIYGIVFNSYGLKKITMKLLNLSDQTVMCSLKKKEFLIR